MPKKHFAWMVVIINIIFLVTSCSEDLESDTIRTTFPSDLNGYPINLTGDWQFREVSPGVLGYNTFTLTLIQDYPNGSITGTLTTNNSFSASSEDWYVATTTSYDVVGTLQASHLHLTVDPEDNITEPPWTYIDFYASDQVELNGFARSTQSGGTVRQEGRRTTPIPLDSTDLSTYIGDYTGTVDTGYISSNYDAGDPLTITIADYTNASYPDAVALLTFSRNGAYLRSIPVAGIRAGGLVPAQNTSLSWDPTVTVRYFGDFAFTIGSPHQLAYRRSGEESYWVYGTVTKDITN